jgi:hypothetical protein
MKKQLIASLVGGIILFIWQFLSWSMLPTHHAEYGYTPNQDRIIEALNQNLSEEGTYMVPGVPPGTPHAEAEALMAPNMGKPWASIHYHKSFSVDMGMNMFRGFVADFFALLLLTWVLLKFEVLNMRNAVQASIFVGLVGYLTIPYLRNIWFEEDSIGYLIDTLVSWGLVGVWLGWWLPRKAQA